MHKKKIINFVGEQDEIKIKIRNGPFDNCPIAKRGVVISPLGKHLRKKVIGKTSPDGICWVLSPMQKVDIFD